MGILFVLVWSSVSSLAPGQSVSRQAQTPVELRETAAEDEALLETWPVAIEGSVRTPAGAPAAGAVVVSSAGGEAVTHADGRFRLELALPIDATDVQLTAVQSAGRSAGVASLRVGGLSPGGAISIGTLLLSAGGTCVSAWLPTFGRNGEVQQPPFDLEVYDDGNGPALYLAGPSGTVSRWTGTAWVPVGTLDNLAWTLAVFDDGSGPALFAGGQFTLADGQPATGLAKWQGAGWTGIQIFGSGVDYTIHSLTVHDDGTGGGPTLYAGGVFQDVLGGMPVNHIMRLEGGSWTNIGSGVPGTSVVALQTFAGKRGGPALYCLEGFLQGGEPRGRIDRWDGTSWSLAIGGFQSTSGEQIHDLEAFDDGFGGGPALYVSGLFSHAGGVPVSNVARWNGTSWSAVGSGPGFTANKLALYDTGHGPVLLAGGPGLLSQWTGASWTPAQELLTDGRVIAFQVFDDGNGAELYAGTAGASFAQPSCIVSKWNGQRFASLGPWLNGDVFSLLTIGAGQGLAPGLHAGGSFSIAGGGSARSIGRWDGNAWAPLGTGMRGTPRCTVQSMAVFDDGSGPALYAGGEFSTAGGVPASNIAKWDGTSWSPVGSGMNSFVSALAVFDDGSGGGPALVAGGGFTIAGGHSCPFVARWNGTSWSALGGSVTGLVQALAVYDDGLGGGPALYAGGSFAFADAAPAANLARWNGLSWSPLGAGTNDRVQVLALFDDGQGSGPALYAGGSFTTAGGAQGRRIARWNGTAWSQPAGGLNGSADSMTVFDDGTGGGPALFVGGPFSTAGSLAARRLAKWNGTSWSTLTSGPTSGTLYALTSFDGSGGPALYAGGNFFVPQGDSYLGRIACDATPPTIQCPVSVVVSTLAATGRTVTFVVSAADETDPAPVVSCTPPSGSFFTVGTTLVTCTATDAGGNQSSCVFPVAVQRRVRTK